MVHDIFSTSKIAKIYSNFIKISFNMLPSCSSGEIYGCKVSMNCFYYIYSDILRE